MNDLIIKLKEGTTKLRTAGKKCDKDIIITPLVGNELTDSHPIFIPLIEGTLVELTAEELPGCTKIRDSAFYGCTSLESVIIPDSVTSIGIYAFKNCTSLTSITIPDSVTSIGMQTFSKCTSLASITIPDSVPTIGYDAFRDCTALETIIIKGDSVKSLSSTSTFGNTLIAKGTGSIYIEPASEDIDINALVEEYKVATNWSTFANQIKPITEYMEA